ncbi:dolichyl-diphosphooligosaccharide---protein glycosyltransferase [Nematocida sp. AWRm80]|nr:dolichyl-diphosphooligosaccharide---protein glycosyltransferase [Nematocida sp. AWRm80]
MNRIIIYATGITGVLSGTLGRLRNLYALGSVINEYDPWYNYKCSKYIWENGIREYFRWKDKSVWIPEGRCIYKSTYPLLFILSNLLHSLVNRIIDVDHYFVCSVTPVIIFLMSIYFLWVLGNGIFVSEKKYRNILSIGLFSISGGIFEKTISGAYDYEGISLLMILIILSTEQTFINQYNSNRSSNNNSNRLLKTASKTDEGYNKKEKNIQKNKSLLRGIYLDKKSNNDKIERISMGITNIITRTVLQSIFNTAWGGSVFTEIVLGIDTLFSLSRWYILGISSVLTMAIGLKMPFLRPINLVFIGNILITVLVMAVNTIRRINWTRTRINTAVLVIVGALTSIIVGVVSQERLRDSIKIFLYQNKIYNLFFRQNKHPLVKSIAEHRPPTVETMFVHGGILFFLLPLSLSYQIWKCLSLNQIKTRVILISMIVSTALYLYMERFSVLVSPFLSIISADTLCDILLSTNKTTSTCKSIRITDTGITIYKYILKRVLIYSTKILALGILLIHIYFSILTYPQMYNTNVIIENNGNILDDFRETAMYLKYNTPEKSIVISWWDYGYQITGMSNRYTVIDNNTNNYQRISEVSSLFLSPETKPSPLLTSLTTTYPTAKIYIYLTIHHQSKYTSPDLFKVPWLAQISHYYNPEIDPNTYFIEHNNQKILNTTILYNTNTNIKYSLPLYNSLLFKLSYYNYLNIQLTNYKLVYQSTNNIVRVFEYTPTNTV